MQNDKLDGKQGNFNRRDKKRTIMASGVKSALYVVSEPACLIPGSGAFHHIEAGLTWLSRHYRVQKFWLCKVPVVRERPEARPLQRAVRTKRSYPVRSFFKWWFILFRNHVGIIGNYRRIKSMSPDFIYERAGHLNFTALIVARLLKIPHFYEVNGVTFKDKSRFFPSVCNTVSFWMEKWAYRKTTCGFYVGGLNSVYNLDSPNVQTVQNGVDQSFCREFVGRMNVIEKKVSLTFIGHAMVHHRLDILADALRRVKRPDAFSLYLIGSNFEFLKAQLPGDIEVHFCGSLTHGEISGLLKTINVGIVTFAKPYYSHVKTFMYGAAKLITVLPDSENFTRIFSEDEVIFFRNADSQDLAEKLDFIEANRFVASQYGERVFERINSSFTWEAIYNETAKTIDKYIE